jgi:hypothetical protein
VNIYREIEDVGAGIINNDNLGGTLANLKHWIDLSAMDKQKMCESAYQVFLRHFNVENAAKKLISTLELY